jgi:hypothetical protein
VLKGVPVNFLAESIVASVTVITLGSLWLANSITKREYEAGVEEKPELTREQWQKVNDDAVAWMHKTRNGQPKIYLAAEDQYNASAKELMRLTREGK